jgi:hypothetical protein
MDRESMIDVIVNDLQDCPLARREFWDHIRSHLSKMSDKGLQDLLRQALCRWCE